MEFGIWNFHSGLWTANNLASFGNGTALTSITTPLPINNAGFAITTGLLNPILTATANNQFSTIDINTTNTQHTIISQENSENSQITTNNDDDEDEDEEEAEDEEEEEEDEDDGNDNNIDENPELTIETTETSQFTNDLSNAGDDNAVVDPLEINAAGTQLNFLTQFNAPVQNFVLNHLNIQNMQQISDDTEESTEEEETVETVSNNEGSNNNNNNLTKENYSIQIINNEQVPSKITNEMSTSKDTIHKCPLTGCDFQVDKIDVLEQHVATIHGENSRKNKKGCNMQRIRYEREEYHCTMCPYTCTTERAYLKHLRMHSLGETVAQIKLSCAICGRDRASESALAKHMKKHRDDRYFCCDICIFRTVQLKKLIQHRRMHTGEKPHLCPHCAYRSARRDNLRSHVRRVHKKDNLWCDTFSPRGMLLAPSASVSSTLNQQLKNNNNNTNTNTS